MPTSHGSIRVLGLGLKVQGLRFGGFRLKFRSFEALGLTPKLKVGRGNWVVVQALGFRVQGLGLRLGSSDNQGPEHKPKYYLEALLT